MTRNGGKAGRKRSLLWGILPLFLVGAGAWVVSRPALEADLQQKAVAALKGAGQDWARVRIEGRDAVLEGSAPSHAALQTAQKVVLNVHGVRRVGTENVKLAPLPAPAVNRVVASRAPLVITGTWSHAPGATLIVELAGKRYELGKAKELRSKDGAWTLTLPTLPADGAHDVIVIVAEDGREARDATTNELLVDTTPPAAPTFGGAGRKDGAWVLTGTWPKKDAKGLVVKVDGRAYELGKAKELAGDGEGNWRLTLPAAALKDGPHEVIVVATDAVGNAASAKGEFTVDTTPPPAAAFTALVTNDPHAVISGTWPADEAKTLEVELDGKTFRLGQAPNLKVQGQRWVLTTDAPLKGGRHRLKMRVADAAGNVRESSAAFDVVVDTTPPNAPTIDSLLANNPRAVISGTWPAEDARGLEVELDGKKYVMGKTEALKVAGKVWKLYPPAPLSEGRHQVLARALDAAGNKAESTREIVIDTTAPGVPEVATVTVRNGERPVLSGPLPADVASMKVTVGNRTWVLGAENSPLVRTNGGWKLALPRALAEGKHDVTIAVSDEAGNVAQKTYPGAIVVLPQEPPKVEEKPAPRPVADAGKCQRDISAFLKEHYIRFRSDSDLLTDEGIEVVAQLANLIRKCPGLRFHIIGHTDSSGGFRHNKELSERRAETVKNALVGAGIGADRLTTEGAGESFPLMSNRTEEGRAVNRRIEVKVIRPE